ncbi:MAG TPA: protein-glutamine glutaminase family protein [Segetibacter sp.]|jgi:hypothetical protein
MLSESKSVFLKKLSDEVPADRTVLMEEATRIFDFFKTSKLFRWQDANNDCEDRANAICILLDSWNIPNYKGWIFSGYFLKREAGSLTNYWNYHVAALLPVKKDDQVEYYIIDPSTAGALITLEEWSSKVTQTPYNYHFIKRGDIYIFPPKNIEKNNWYKRDKRNFRWTMQGLSGINGVSAIGKAQLFFKKRKVKVTEMLFNNMKKHKLVDPFIAYKEMNKQVERQ